MDKFPHSNNYKLDNYIRLFVGVWRNAIADIHPHIILLLIMNQIAVRCLYVQLLMIN